MLVAMESRPVDGRWTQTGRLGKCKGHEQRQNGAPKTKANSGPTYPPAETEVAGEQAFTMYA